MMITNKLSLVDRAARPGAYNATIFDNILSRGKYSLKPTDARHGATPLMNTTCTHIHEKVRSIVKDAPCIQTIFPLTICHSRRKHSFKIAFHTDDRVLLCNDV